MDRLGSESADASMAQRIAARRAALEAKMKAAKRQGGEPGSPTQAGANGKDEKEGKGEEQVTRSRQELASLKASAVEAVTRYRVLTDAHEGKRRIKEEGMALDRHAKIDEDASHSHKAHGCIQMSFDNLFDSDPNTAVVPQELMAELTKQRHECQKVIDIKDKLIDELRRQMVSKEEEYVSSLKKQADDIDRLIETMHSSTETLVNAYQRELRSIEDAFVQERRELIDQNDGEISALIAECNVRDREQFDARKRRVEVDQKKLDEKYEENAEKFNKAKSDNLNDIHTLAQELESLHAKFMLNQEKLHYNLRVLHERVNENKKASDLHRKKLGRLQDVLSTLLAKYHETDKRFQQTNRELTEGYRRVTEQYKDLQLKFQHFEKADAEKYSQVWKMHEDDCMQLVHKCLQGDRVVFEEMLGVKWHSPSLDFWLSPAAEETQGADGLNNSQTEQAAAGGGVDAAAVADELGDAAITVLQIIYSQVPFLLEEKVRRVIDGMDEEEAGDLKVEAVLNALDIKSTDEVRQMIDFFAADSEDGQITADPQIVVRSLQDFLSDRAAKKQDATASLKLDFKKTGGGGAETQLAAQSEKKKKREAEAQQRLRQREFWTRMANVVPESHLRLWTGMEKAMNKYHRQLQKRQDLISSTDDLRQQNDELRSLLNNYLSSGVNDELFSPPQLQVAGPGAAGGAQ